MLRMRLCASEALRLLNRGCRKHLTVISIIGAEGRRVVRENDIIYKNTVA